MATWSAEEIEEKKRLADEKEAKAIERRQRQPPDDDEEEGKEAPNETYLTLDEAKLKYQKTALWLATNHKSGRIKARLVKGMTRYSDNDIVALLESEQDRTASADAIRSATSLVKQTQDAMAQMFNMTFRAQETLLGIMQKSTEQSHNQVLELETSIREMRRITDKANTDEYARELMKQESEQKMVMQQRAFTSLQTILIPYVQKKMNLGTSGGGSAPAAPMGPTQKVEPGINPDQKTMLADGIISWFSTLPPEAVEKMKQHLPPEHAVSFGQIADLLKGNEL